MCRSIKPLRSREVVASEPEIEAAALQFVRKVSGYRQPSQKHAVAFEAAVVEVAQATRRLLASVTQR